MVAAPETTVQVPVPMVGVLALRLVDVTPHNVWSGPASEVVGKSKL